MGKQIPKVRCISAKSSCNSFTPIPFQGSFPYLSCLQPWRSITAFAEFIAWLENAGEEWNRNSITATRLYHLHLSSVPQEVLSLATNIFIKAIHRPDCNTMAQEHTCSLMIKIKISSINCIASSNLLVQVGTYKTINLQNC